MTRKFLLYPLLILLVVAGAVHATVQVQANKQARLIVSEMLDTLNTAGMTVSTGKISAKPYTQEILVENLVIEGDHTLPHHVGLLRLSELELNEQGSFINAMHIDFEDMRITLSQETAEELQPIVLWQTIQALGIEDGQLSQTQSIRYRYDAEARQLQLDSYSHLFNASRPQQSLYEIEVTTRFSQLPDLEQQFARLVEGAEQSELAPQWLGVGLLKTSIHYQDHGLWSAYRTALANQAGMTEQAFQMYMKQTVSESLANLSNVSPNIHQTISSAAINFIDADKPQLQLSIGAIPPEGVNIAMALMASLISPNALENFFEFDLSVDIDQNERSFNF